MSHHHRYPSSIQRFPQPKLQRCKRLHSIISNTYCIRALTPRAECDSGGQQLLSISEPVFTLGTLFNQAIQILFCCKIFTQKIPFRRMERTLESTKPSPPRSGYDVRRRSWGYPMCVPQWQPRCDGLIIGRAKIVMHRIIHN